MYITLGTAVYGYISYEFLGLFEAVLNPNTANQASNCLFAFKYSGDCVIAFGTCTGCDDPFFGSCPGVHRP